MWPKTQKRAQQGPPIFLAKWCLADTNFYPPSCQSRFHQHCPWQTNKMSDYQPLGCKLQKARWISDVQIILHTRNSDVPHGHGHSTTQKMWVSILPLVLDSTITKNSTAPEKYCTVVTISPWIPHEYIELIYSLVPPAMFLLVHNSLNDGYGYIYHKHP